MPPRAEPKGRLRRNDRVRKRREYQTIQGHGARVSLAHFVLIFALRAEGQLLSPRLGITASRKIGGAVQRNRAKRLVREAFRSRRELFPGDLDLVVIVRAPLGDMRLEDVVHEWDDARGRIAQRVGAVRRARLPPSAG